MVDLLVGPRPGRALGMAQLMTAVGSHDRGVVPGLGIHRLHVPASAVEALIPSLTSDPAVAFVERDVRMTADLTPNDPFYPHGYEWGLDQIGAPDAWDTSTGTGGPVIAVIDTGVDASHEDLGGRVLPGYDFFNSDADPSDDNGHGTHVAGIIAATGDNGIGGAGVCWGCRILPVKVLDATGSGWLSTVAAGIVWAADHGATILNLSLGGSTPSDTLDQAVAHAQAAGAVVVAAAGNAGTTARSYPAAVAGVIAVAAADTNAMLYPWSNFGPDWVSVAAPGCTTSTWPNGAYHDMCGTSMATPFVSGSLGLLAAAAPTAGLADATRALLGTAGPALRDVTADGVIHLGAAMSALRSGVIPDPVPLATPSPTATPVPDPTASPTAEPTETPSPEPSAAPGPSPDPTASSPAAPSFTPDGAASELDRLLNGERTTHGLPALAVDPFLAIEARDGPVGCPDGSGTMAGRAKDMALSGYVSHALRLCPTYDVGDAMRSWGYSSYVGETIAWHTGYDFSPFPYQFGCDVTQDNCIGVATSAPTTVAMASYQLMTSQGHRDVVLSSEFDRFACGAWQVPSSEFPGESSTYYACLFAFGPGTTPVPDPTPAPPGPPAHVQAVTEGGDATVSWSAPADVADPPITAYEVTASPGGATCSWSSGPLSCTVTHLPDGLYTFAVTASNDVGSGPASAPSVQVRIDTTPPAITAPVASLNVNTAVGSTASVRVAWSGADAGSGIAKYEVWLSTKGGAYVLVSSPTAAVDARWMAVSSTTTYRFRVRAFDVAGNVSPFADGSIFHVKLVQQTSTAVHTSASWYTSYTASASGGSYRSTSTAGRSSSYTFSGRAIAIAATKGVAFGSFKVYVDGAYRATVSDYAAATQWRRIVYSLNLASGTHTIKLVCSGTAGHPRIDLDAFLVLG